jgi:peroxiredoxin
MVREGDTAPDVSAKMATDSEELESFSLAEAVADGPVVLAFFPLAFSSVCTTQVADIQTNHYDALVDLDANVYGVSVDSPFTLSEFREEEGLTFPLVSDFNREIVEAFDLATDAVGYEDVAQRAVFVIDEDQTVVYADVLEDGSEIPEMKPVRAALESVATA